MESLVPVLEDFSKKRIPLNLSFGLIFIAIIIGCFIWPELFGYFLALCLVLAMAIGPFLGRYWCNWLCPRGSFLEYFTKYFCSSERRSKEKFPSFFKNTYAQILLVMVFMVMMGINLYNLYPSVGLFNGVGITLTRLLIVSTIAAILLSIFVHPRAWCAICPGGTFAKITALYNPKTPYLIIEDTCEECHTCSQVCPLKIDSSNYKAEGVVNHPDCLKCFTCLKNCPTESLQFLDENLPK
jgi:ferredoxin-type protein NapH